MKKELKGNRFPAPVLISGFLLLCPVALHANNAMGEEDCPLVTPDLDDSILLTREERVELMEQKLKEALSRVQDCRQNLRDAQKKNNNSADADSSADAAADSSADAAAADAAADSSADSAAADSSADAAAADAESEADNAENNANQLSDNDEQNSAETEQNNNPQTAVPDNELSGTEMPPSANEQSEPQGAANAMPKAEQNNNPQTAVPDSELSGTEMPSGADEQSAPRESSAMPSGKLVGTETPEPENAGAASDPAEEPPSVTKRGESTLSNGKLPEDIPPANNDDIIARQIREAALAEPDSQKQARLWNEYRRYKGMPTRSIKE